MGAVGVQARQVEPRLGFALAPRKAAGGATVSGLVVGVFEAHPRRGGAGALYVYLKRQR